MLSSYNFQIKQTLRPFSKNLSTTMRFPVDFTLVYAQRVCKNCSALAVCLIIFLAFSGNVKKWF